MDKESRINTLFYGKKLPSLPTLYTELQKLLASPFTSNRRIAELIKKDQSMMVKILQLSNSPLYGKRQEIKTLLNAITYLGVDTLKNLVFQLSLIKMMHFKSDKVMDFSPVAFWEHSIGTAYFSQFIVDSVRLPPNENYYIAGLLHDIGKLLIFSFYPSKFEDIVLDQMSDDINNYDAEIRVLGVDHTEIGAYLAEKWKFHKEIVNSIGYHHKMLPSRMDTVTAVVSIANMYATKCGLCLPWDGERDILASPAWTYLLEKSGRPIDAEKLMLNLLNESENIKGSVAGILKGM